MSEDKKSPVPKILFQEKSVKPIFDKALNNELDKIKNDLLDAKLEAKPSKSYSPIINKIDKIVKKFIRKAINYRS